MRGSARSGAAFAGTAADVPCALATAAIDKKKAEFCKARRRSHTICGFHEYRIDTISIGACDTNSGSENHM